MACVIPLRFSQQHPGRNPCLTWVWVSSPLSRASPRTGRTSCVFIPTHTFSMGPHFFLKGIPQLCWNWKHFVFMYRQLLREGMQSPQHIWSQESSQQPRGQNLTKSTYTPRKEAQSHPEGAPGSHANGREWKTQERKYKDSVSYHEPRGVAREWSPCLLWQYRDSKT